MATKRQRQIFQLIADGRMRKQVANDLSISDTTVRCHVKTVKRDLGAKSTTDAVVKLMRRGEIK
jgi:DNA-binding NarL/FixJ family response regulator